MTSEKTTLVLGASPKPDRFSYKAILALQRKNIPVVALGKRKADVNGLSIMIGMPADIGKIHTITLYMSSKNQIEYYDYILSIQPKRIIFNPGTENPELAEAASLKGIEVVNDCILVMINSGKF
jgi:predicted CoA-binding protein